MDDQIRILCVDDEASILKALVRVFMDSSYEILTADSGEEGLTVLEKTYPIQVVMSDYRMPGMNGVDFLREVCKQWPDTVRIVLSGYADTASVVAAINEGEIYKFIPKPWNDDELKVTISNAVERYMLHQSNKELTIRLSDANEELSLINNNLEMIVKERTDELLFQNSALRRSQNILNLLPFAVMGLDLDGTMVLTNKKSRELFSEATLGNGLSHVFHDRAEGLLADVVRNGAMTAPLTYNGTTLRVKGILMPEDEGQQGIVMVFEEEK